MVIGQLGQESVGIYDLAAPASGMNLDFPIRTDDNQSFWTV